MEAVSSSDEQVSVFLGGFDDKLSIGKQQTLSVSNAALFRLHTHTPHSASLLSLDSLGQGFFGSVGDTHDRVW